MLVQGAFLTRSTVLTQHWQGLEAKHEDGNDNQDSIEVVKVTRAPRRFWHLQKVPNLVTQWGGAFWRYIALDTLRFQVFDQNRFGKAIKL